MFVKINHDAWTKRNARFDGSKLKFVFTILWKFSRSYNSFLLKFHEVVPPVLHFLYSKLICRLEIVFRHLLLVVTGVMDETDSAYSVRSTLLSLILTRLIFHNSIQFVVGSAELMILSRFSVLQDMLFSFVLCFLWVLSLEFQLQVNHGKFCPGF